MVELQNYASAKLSPLMKTLWPFLITGGAMLGMGLLGGRPRVNMAGWATVILIAPAGPPEFSAVDPYMEGWEE